MDTYISYIFVVEVIIKLIGFGIYNYFNDNWNKFDFTLACFTIFLDAGFSSVRLFRTAKAGKAARIGRLGKS